MAENVDPFLSKYAEIHASHLKQATRTWTTLAVLSIYCLSVDISSNAGVPLPLVDAKLPSQLFAVVAIGLLTALMTHWQEVLNRANHLRQGVVQARIDQIQSKDFDAKAQWDALVTPSTQAVWGLTSPLARSSNRLLRLFGMLYFVFLKLMSYFVHVGLPATALVVLICGYPKDHCFQLLDVFFLVFSLNTVFQVIVATLTELRYTSRTFSDMWKLIAPPSA